MRSLLMLLVGTLAVSTVAHAQIAPAPSKGYVEATAQSAFGNVTSQSYGVEFGVTLASPLQVFVEAGQVLDVAPAGFGASAQLIAGFLSRTQPDVAFRLKEPAAFGLAGLRCLLSAGAVEPYVLAGGGIARVKKDVSFTVAGTDVTGNLQQFGVVLGTDLSGAETKPMLTLGAGVAWPAWQHMVIDFQYRYGRVLASDQGINVNRAGVGVGIRF
jgi:opacity protein-like surface antigen